MPILVDLFKILIESIYSYNLELYNMTNSNKFKLSEDLKVAVFTKKEIEKEELDSESDFKDFITSKIKTANFKEIFSNWSNDDRYYVVFFRS